MNREIKLRAFDDKDGIEPAEMIYFDLTKLDSKCGEYGVWQGDKYLSLVLHHLPIMQFTGLKDKNGVDIYEGDVIRLCEDKMGIRLIVERYKTGFDFHQLQWGARLYECATEGQIEILGNIHENPELIK